MEFGVQTFSYSYNAPNTVTVSSGCQYLCPDLLAYDRIGAADGCRGRVVRAFFWLMRVWKP